MQYTIQIFETVEGFAARSDSVHQDAYWTSTMAYLAALKEAGVFITGAGLQPPATATTCLLYTSPSPRDLSTSRMPSSA